MHRFKQQVFRYRFVWVLLALITIGSTSYTLLIAQSGQRASNHEGGIITHTVALSKLPLLTDKTPMPLASVSSVPVAVETPCPPNGVGKLVLVSISQQHAWACDGMSMIKDSAVNTGASAITNVDDSTPTGTWHIYAKQTNLNLTGSDANGSWNDAVAYWMPFHSDYGFHDASWQTMPFGSASYTTQGSHGCVHLPAAMMAWVYNWAPIGTTVTIES